FPDGSAAEKMMAHQFKQPTPVSQLNPDVPSELIAVIDRLMQKAPDGRFATTGDVIEALRPLAAAPSLVRPPVRANSQPAPEGLRTLTDAATQPGFKAALGATAVSAPTPRPQTLGALPTRASMRGQSNIPAAPKPEPSPIQEKTVSPAPDLV